MPSYVLAPLLLQTLGRRRVVSGGHLLTAAAFLVVIFLNDPTTKLVVWLIGKFAIATGLLLRASIGRNARRRVSFSVYEPLCIRKRNFSDIIENRLYWRLRRLGASD